MEALAGILLGVFLILLILIDKFNINSREQSDDERQIENLSDGFGGVFVDDEYLTQQEAEDIQARGELYDTHYR
jgi:hypothetical protein